MDTQAAGDAGELSAMCWFVSRGASVSLPIFDHPDYDLVVDFGDRVERVQVEDVDLSRARSVRRPTFDARGKPELEPDDQVLRRFAV